jgi:hypothetical protein
MVISLVDARNTITLTFDGYMPTFAYGYDFGDFEIFKKSRVSFIATLTEVENAIYMRQ